MRNIQYWWFSLPSMPKLPFYALVFMMRKPHILDCENRRKQEDNGIETIFLLFWRHKLGSKMILIFIYTFPLIYRLSKLTKWTVRSKELFFGVWLESPFCGLSVLIIFYFFCDFQIRPKWTTYKHESDKNKKFLSVFNFGILSIIVNTSLNQLLTHEFVIIFHKQSKLFKKFPFSFHKKLQNIYKIL